MGEQQGNFKCVPGPTVQSCTTFQSRPQIPCKQLRCLLHLPLPQTIVQSLHRSQPFLLATFLMHYTFMQPNFYAAKLLCCQIFYTCSQSYCMAHYVYRLTLYILPGSAIFILCLVAIPRVHNNIIMNSWLYRFAFLLQ